MRRWSIIFAGVALAGCATASVAEPSTAVAVRTEPEPQSDEAEPAPDAPHELEREAEAELATEPEEAPEQEWEASPVRERYLARECSYGAVRSQARARLRDGDYGGAAAMLERFGASDAAAEGEFAGGAGAMLAHVRWVAGLDAQVRALGAAWLSRPRRGFVLDETFPRDTPGGEHRGGYAAIPGSAVDVWAEVPGGPLLVARPEDTPSFRIGVDRYAAMGWLARSEVSAQPPQYWVNDDDRPLEILRPDASRDRWAFGGSCVTCGQPGLGFNLHVDSHVCMPVREMCGAPGVNPPSFESDEPIVGYCADCPSYFRSFRRVGEYCRSSQPGSTWQCAPDAEHLECTPPAARAGE